MNETMGGGAAAARRVRSRAGVTLIELLTVTLIIGILAVIALPRLERAREQAHFAAITSGLRNLGASQERYYQTSFEYAPDLEMLDFEPTPGVEVVVTEATGQGWAAVATHSSLSADQGCAIYLGNAVPPPLPDGELMTSDPGVIECAR